MDATWWWWLCLCQTISHIFVFLFFASLFYGLDDVASRSPAAWKRMEFLTAILGTHPFDIPRLFRRTIYFFSALFCTMTKDITAPSPPEIGKFISKASGQQYRTHVAFCICAWINVSARLIAEGNWFFVGTVSSLSMASVFEFMVVASSMDSLVLARWVMAQSTVVAVILLFQGYFLQAGVSFIPFLPAAIYAMHNSVDKLYCYMPLASVSSFEGGTEKRSKTGGQNQNVANTTQMAIKVTNTVDMSTTVANKGLASVEDKCVDDLKYIKEGEGFCGSKSNAGCGD